MDTTARAQTHIPTHQEVCDFALALALDQGVEDRAKLDLLHWPENAPPPAGELYTYEWAMEFREKARIALTERMNPEGEMEILYDCLDPRFAVKRKADTLPLRRRRGRQLSNSPESSPSTPGR